jgi:hypothetical protein
VYPTLKAQGCKVGVIVEQPSEALMIWQGEKYLHGSSLNGQNFRKRRRMGNMSASTWRAVQKRRKKEYQSTGMVITQKPLMVTLTKSHRDETNVVANVRGMLFYELLEEINMK